MTSATETRPAWGWFDAVGIWVAQFVGSAVWFAVLVAVFFSGTAPATAPIWLLAAGQMVQWVAYTVGPVAVTKRKGDGPVADLGLTLRPLDVPLGVVAGVALQIALLPVLYWPIGRFTDADPGQTARSLVDRIDGPADVALLAFVVVVAAPIVEELFFRGLLLQGLRRSMTDGFAILLSSALFALVHIDPILFPGTFAVGLLTAFARVRTGRLGPSWAVHLGFNATTLVLLTW